ncbi:MAG TPA: hypothetical protein VM100_14540 [Longimicrobiales bacterium]|nr:hypothetical protein [Longimicrobiales bacterium]
MSDRLTHPTPEKLQGYAETSLDAAEQAVLASHVVSCSTCQHEVEEWRSLFNVLSTLPQLEPSKHFADLVMSNVKLPDPWYMKSAARVKNEMRLWMPKTTRGWTFATATLGVPFFVFGALFAWLLSHPFVTPQSVATFAADKGYKAVEAQASGTFAALLQSDVGLWLARILETLRSAGLGTVGAFAAGIAVGIGVSAWVLYTNLRTNRTRAKNDYVSYCF